MRPLVPRPVGSLEHGLEVLGNLEGCLGLALNLLHGNTIGNLDKRQSGREVDIEHTLTYLLASSPNTHRLR